MNSVYTHLVSHPILLHFSISISFFISTLLTAVGPKFIVLFLFQLSKVIDVHCKKLQRDQKGKKIPVTL